MLRWAISEPAARLDQHRGRTLNWNPATESRRCTPVPPGRGRSGAQPVRYRCRVANFLQWVRRPRSGARLAAGFATVVGLLPVLLNLPRVSVVACFDNGHPLYQWVPQTDLAVVHCVTAPAPVVSWTLMIGATLVVQLVVLPLLIAAGAILLRGARRLAHSAGQALAAALIELTDLVTPERRPAPGYVRVPNRNAGWSRANPRRGPPACLS